VKPVNQEVVWLRRGRQRRAVAQAITKPITETQILERARSWAPRIQLRDVWYLLRQLREKKFAYCLTPRLTTGKLYFLTNQGRAAVTATFGQAVSELPHGIDWNRYALVVRARTRREVLEEVARRHALGKEGRTASEIRRQLLDRHPVGLNPTLRAIAVLAKLRLTRPIDRADTGRSKLYVLTAMGRRIVEELRR
jgi:hypothetical protein